MDLIFCLEWINFWVKLDRICFFIIYFNLIILLFIIETVVVILAEWLTRWPAKPFPFGSAGSSPAGDDPFLSGI